MVSARKTYSALVVIILLISSLAGTVLYYTRLVSDNNSKIASLISQIADLTNQISILKAQGQANVASSYLVKALGISEIPAQIGLGGIPPYSHLWIVGTVTNKGLDPAYHAGLVVFGYSANGTVEISMTVPFTSISPGEGGWFGTDAKINDWLSSNGDFSPPQLGNLDTGATANVNIHIFHEGEVSNWTVTPVCANSP
jgi:hypothetical protein